MRALVISGIGQSELRDVAEPQIGPGEVMVSISHVGLCGSDLATFTGMNPLVALPRIPGHEIGGEILAVGRDVPGIYRPGRRVTILPYTSCGQCTSCRKGRINACRYNRTLGVQQDGALTERITLPADKVILNDLLPPRHLPLVEPLAVGFHAIRRGRVAPGDHLAVIGCGMIGMGVLLGAVGAGARVTAIDVSRRKLELARSFGAAEVIDASSDNVTQAADNVTGGDGFDVVVEAVGSPETVNQAVDLASFSGRVVYIGYSKAPVTYDTKFFNLKELDISGSRNATIDDFKAVIGCLERLGDRADALISRVFAFENAPEALPYWASHREETLKVIVELVR